MEREGTEQVKTDAVVFLRGFSSMKEAWVRVASNVDKKYQCRARTHPRGLPGKQTAPVSRYDGACRQESAHWSCSTGGMIGGEYAAKYPERVRSLTLVCPAGISMSNKSDGLRTLEETSKNLLLAHAPDDINKMNKLASFHAREYPRFLAGL